MRRSDEIVSGYGYMEEDEKKMFNRKHKPPAEVEVLEKNAVIVAMSMMRSMRANEFFISDKFI